MYLAAFFLFLLSADLTLVSAKGHALNRLPRHHDHIPRPVVDTNATQVRRRRTCKPKAVSAMNKSITKATATTKAIATTKATPTASTHNVLGVAFKPDNWPTHTQAGAAPAATRTSAADPFLMELSKSYNNKNNHFYTKVHTGDMTFYNTGMVACGDTYDDTSFTAAVSKAMYDSWPGATAETNRNPICGPYVPGRKSLTPAGTFATAVHAPSFVNIGGDGLLNCDPASQCHVPLTATVRHGEREIVVQIVDRCEGCKEGDIDLTPGAFEKLAGLEVGRTEVVWWFNQY